MSILKTDLTLFENLSDWKFKENFTTVTSEFGELDIHFVDENIDTGAIICQNEITIEPNDTGESLYKK